MFRDEIQAHVQQMREALTAGQKITAIKALRTITGTGLVESKEIVEMILSLIEWKEWAASPPAAPAKPEPDPDLAPHIVLQFARASEQDIPTGMEHFSSRSHAMSEAQFFANSGARVMVARVVAVCRNRLEEV